MRVKTSILAGTALILLAAACTDRILGVRWPADYALTHYLDQELPTNFGIRIIMGGTGSTISCTDTLRASTLAFDADGSVSQLWTGENYCSDSRPAVPFSRTRAGAAQRNGTGVIITWNGPETWIDSLEVRGSELVQVLTINRTSESGPTGTGGGVDTLHMRYRRLP